MAPIGPQGVTLLGDMALLNEVWLCWRRCVTRGWALRSQKLLGKLGAKGGGKGEEMGDENMRERDGRGGEGWSGRAMKENSW